MYKTCTKCKTTKEIHEFYSDRSTQDGYHSWCRDCNLGSVRERRAKKRALLPPKPNLLERFWSKVDIRGDDECWEWKGTRFTHSERYTKPISRGIFHNGYKDGKQVNEYAYRTSWRLHYGEIPDGLFVCHKCDNGLCVNPKHLFLGTAKDNYDDMIAKGRSKQQRYPKNTIEHEKIIRRGETAGNSKLQPSDVLDIRRLKAEGYSLSKLAAQFHIDQSAVSLIVNRKRWTHI